MKTLKFLVTSLLSLVACAVSVEAVTIQTTTAASPTLNINLTSYTNNASFLMDAYRLYWRVDKAALVIYLALDVATAGWVGFGIADPDNGGMRGSDIVTLFVSSNETHSVTSLTDRYALQHALPAEDICNQWNVTDGWQSGNRTVVAFNRKLDTGDTQDRPIKAGPVKIIFAYSADGSKLVAYHGTNKHASSVIFFEDEVKPKPLQETVVVWNYTNPPTPISPKETKYVCTGFAFIPTAPGSNTTISGQIVEIAPLVNPSTAMYVHHYVVSACDPKNPKYQQMLNNPTECFVSNFTVFDVCPFMIYAWAPGTGTLTFPANAGLPFGNSEGAIDISHLMLEVHYNNDNPNMTPNLTDISGVSFTYTTTKREHNAGLLTIGDTNVLGGFMPFGSPRVEKEYVCPGECTSKWPWDITVFASFLHMHAYGKQIWTGVTTPSPAGNNVVVTSDLDRANFYEFGFQHNSVVNRTIKRGDRINLHCVYDVTTNLFPHQRPNDTGVTFSLGTEDEMCLNFLYYYPILSPSGQFSTCGLYENQTTSCGEFNKDSPISIKIQNPVTPGSATADPPITGIIGFGTDYSNGTCVFDAAHLALVPNGTVVYQKENATNTSSTNANATKNSTNDAGRKAITSWNSAIIVAAVVAMVILV